MIPIDPLTFSEPPVLQRTSSRVTKPPDYYGMIIYTATELGKEPETVTEALSSTDAKLIKTPVNVNSKLLKAMDDSELADQILYQSAMGILLYLTTRTRPDIVFAINSCAHFCSKPMKEHWTAVKRIFRYLRGTIQLGLVYTKG